MIIRDLFLISIQIKQKRLLVNLLEAFFIKLLLFYCSVKLTGKVYDVFTGFPFFVAGENLGNF